MENSPTPGSSSTSPQTFTGRGGTRDEGKDFEELTIISKCLQLAFDSNVTEFNISSDDVAFGDFDDLVIETKYINGKEEKIAYQLKHVEDEDGLLTPKILGGTGKKFAIAKYYQNSGKIPHEFSLILYTNKKFKMDKGKLTMDCKIGGADILVDVFKTDHKNLHEFRVSKAENIPKPDSDNYENFLKRFKLQSNQENTTQLERRLMKEFLKIHGTEDTFRQFRDFIRKWKKEKKKKLDKRTVTIKIVESLLTPFVKTISHDLYYTDFGAILRKAILSFNFTTFEETNEVIHKIWISGVSDREIYKCGIKQYLLTEGLDKIMDEKMRAHKYSLISWHLVGRI